MGRERAALSHYQLSPLKSGERRWRMIGLGAQWAR